MEIRFPRLGKLHPTVESTILKLTEEVGELSREIMRKPRVLECVVSELLDVAQTCATLMFLVKGEDMAGAVKAHLWKLVNKGYLKRIPDGDFGVVERGGVAVFILPPLDITPSLEATFFKLAEEAGELAQAAGKRRGLSGEPAGVPDFGIAAALLDVVQVCVTMLYILERLCGVNVEDELEAHVQKLQEHGYL